MTGYRKCPVIEEMCCFHRAYEGAELVCCFCERPLLVQQVRGKKEVPR